MPKNKRWGMFFGLIHTLALFKKKVNTLKKFG